MRISGISTQSRKDKKRLGLRSIGTSLFGARVALAFVLTLAVFLFGATPLQADEIGLRPVGSSLQIIAPPPTPTIRLYYDLEAVVAQGKTVYRSHCAACHGIHLEGQPNWHLRDAQGYLPVRIG